MINEKQVIEFRTGVKGFSLIASSFFKLYITQRYFSLRTFLYAILKNNKPRLVCTCLGVFVIRASQNFVYSLSYTVHRTILMVVLPQASSL